ncbi:MAG: M15 family metallopeptidase [Acidobacteria bacterium]|nr:M15 family metallopeptidase [Acidobacteriota bacterium]MCI0626606.1 M15 family metallopeptidase [Acidobacteriota bacterium]MCI0719419.1 M15 family metallopeptidase [Acidobacteriota bacterium]
MNGKTSSSRNLQRLRLALLLWSGLAGLASAAFPQDKPPEIRTGQVPLWQPDLVELITLDATLRLDIRYATSNNLVGRPVYDEARAFLQRPAAEALVRANQALKKQGYGLLIFDGYRPWSVTKIFWEVTPPEKRQFVANPALGSKHNHGCAVDVSLYNLKTGREVSMPSAYDEMTERAHPTYGGGTRDQRAARDLLRKAMEEQGFAVYPIEWWHFDYKDWRQYPILNIPFDQIAPAGKGR